MQVEVETLLLKRCAVNLLTNALAHSASGRVVMRMKPARVTFGDSRFVDADIVQSALRIEV